jgi:membrane-bound metal-dependent hydrolase YbcI (DUF457 family)
MSPLAHAGIGLLGWQWADRRKTAGTLALFLFAANWADIDFAFSLFLGNRGLFRHQFYTHNVFFVLAGCALLSLLLPRGGGRWGLILTGLLHLPLDIIVVDTVAPVGIRLFWPLSSGLWNVAFFPFLERGPWRLILSPKNFLVLGLEFVCFVLPVLLLYRRSLGVEFRRPEFRRF